MALAAPVGVHAAATMRTKANNLTDLNQSSSWDLLPTAMHLANWNTAYTQSGTLLLGANLSWLGIQSTSASAVNIGGTNTLTLGRAGIVMSAAGGNLTISSNLTLLANTNQIWNIGTGRTLTFSGSTFIRESGASLNVVVAGTGAVEVSNLVNDASGILGAWATFGAGTATKYAAISGGYITGVDGVPVASANNISDISGVLNYNVAAVGAFAAGTSFNTVRYAGGAGTITGNYQANGLMNVGDVLVLSGNATIGDTRELVVNVPTASITLSGVIADNAGGASGLIKTGTGTLSLTNNNSYTGVTTISAGTVTVSHSNALGSTVGETIIVGQDSAGTGIPAVPGGLLRITNNVNLAERLILQGLGNNSGFLINNDSGSNTLSGLVTLVGAEAVRLGLSSGSQLTVTGGISGNGSFFVLNPSANSTLSFTTTPINMGSGGRFYQDTAGTVAVGVSGNTWTQTTIASGAMRMDIAAAIPAASTVAIGLSYQPGGTWNLNGFNQSVGSLSSGTNIPAARVITSAGAAALTVNQTTSQTYNGLISGGLALTKTGTGTLTLYNGDNSYTGDTVISGGVLLVHNYAASPVQSGTVAVSSATSATVTVANATGLAAGQPIVGTGIPAGSYIASIAGNVLTITTPSTATAGTISDVAISGLTGSLKGSTLFYNGQGGTLQFGNSTTSYTLGGLRGSQNLSLLNTATVPAPVALSIGANNASTAYSGALSGAGASVTKAGTGSLELQGANTYTGATTVNAGKLVVSGSLSASSGVSVAAGASAATLASGNNLTSSVGAVTLASDANGGATLAPGDTGGSGTSSIGRLNVNGALTLGTLGTSGQARLSLELGGTSAAGTLYDQVVTTGNVSLNNVSLDLSLVSGFAQTIRMNDTFTIILNGGANPVSGTFANAVGNVVSIGAFAFDVNYSANVNGGFNDVVLTVVAVPEPGALGSLLAGAGVLVGLRRYRRRTSVMR